ncbi:hypothetical protein ACFX1X_014545 [Malus domestica]
MDLYGRSPARGFNKRPMKGWKGRSPVKARSQRSISRSPPYSRSPVKVSRSRSPVRSSRRSASRSSGRFRSRKTASRSLLRAPSGNNHRSYSRSPSPVARRVRSPLSPDRGRSLSRSVSPDASPKRVRRGRGFSQRYSYARRYRTPSLSPPVRSYRYGGGRSDRDRSLRSQGQRKEADITGQRKSSDPGGIPLYGEHVVRGEWAGRAVIGAPVKLDAVIGASRSHPASLSESRLLEDIKGGISTTPVR